MALSQQELLDLIKEHAPELPVDLVTSIYAQESSSGKNTNHPPKGGAVGGFGVTPGAAKEVGVDPGMLGDERTNAIAGIRYLGKQYKESGNDSFAAAARYFGGPKAMSNLGITDETGKSRGDYAKEVLARAGITAGSMKTMQTASGNVPSELFGKMMESFGVSQQTNKDATEVLDKAAENYSTSMDTAIAAQTKSGDLLQKYILDLANQKIMKAGVAANNAAIAGLDKSDVNNTFALTVKEFQQNAEETRIYANAIKDASMVSLADDPLQFLNNQLVAIPQLTTAHNQAARVANENYNRLIALNQMVQTQNVTDSATIADISIKGVIAHADNAVQEATLKAEQLRQSGLTTIAGLFVNKASLATKDLNEFQQIAQMQALQDYRKDVLANKGEADKAKALKAESLAKYVADLANLGYTPETFKGLKKENQDRVDQIIATGRLGDSPMDAILGLRLIPSLKLTPGQAKLSSLFGEIYNGSGVDSNPLFTKTAQKIEAGDRAIKTTIEQMRDNPTQGDKNPFSLPNPSVMNELVKANSEISPVFKNVIKILGDTTQGTKVDDFAIIQTAVTQIGEQGYTREMAIKDLSTYYKLGIQTNNSTYGFKDFGISPQQTYKVSISVPNYIPAANKDKEVAGVFNSSTGIFGTKIKADLSNDMALSNVVTLLQAQRFSRFGFIPQSFSESRKEPEGLGLLTKQP